MIELRPSEHSSRQGASNGHPLEELSVGLASFLGISGERQQCVACVAAVAVSFVGEHMRTVEVAWSLFGVARLRCVLVMAWMRRGEPRVT